MFDLARALKRALEREASLLWNLKEVLVALDESAAGPTVAILPRFQIERIEAAIEQSEEEIEGIQAAINDLSSG